MKITIDIEGDNLIGLQLLAGSTDDAAVEETFRGVVIAQLDGIAKQQLENMDAQVMKKYRVISVADKVEIAALIDSKL